MGRRSPDEEARRVSGTAEESAGFASPACSAHEADPAYMGGIDREELVGLLNTLLEAERAGAKVCADFCHRLEAPEARALLEEVRRDEARFCGLLRDLIGRLGGTPSAQTGDFYDRALAIPDLAERLRFLNRGQNWVAKRLSEALPRIPDDDMHAALSEMRHAHVENIARCEALLADLAR